jgi:hypothetical protein
LAAIPSPLLHPALHLACPEVIYVVSMMFYCSKKENIK